MEKMKSICVYCGSSNNISDIYKNAAKEVGKILAENNVRLIYGGGRVGLMGVVADSVMANNGKVTGFIPQYLHEYEVGHNSITELFIVDTMHERKRLMFEHSDAFIVLPGGFGTLDEICEILTWKQLRLHNKPIIFIDINQYWSPLFDTFVDHMIDKTFVRSEHKDFYKIIQSTEKLPSLIQAISPEKGLNLASKWW